MKKRTWLLGSIMVLLLTLLVGMGGSQAQEVQSSGGIPCYQPTRLLPGASARVTTDSLLPNRMRSDPSLRNNVIARIPAGQVVALLSGPVCSEGFYWWEVNYNGLIGWTAEGNGWNQYWLEPVSVIPPTAPTPIPACALVPRLIVGGQGRVTPGLPNVVRTHPGTQSSGAWYSEVIGEIPGGGVFTVLNGPQCGPDGRWWWQVDHFGLVGWTAEGEGVNTYWTEPVTLPGAPQCPGFMVSRLVPGQLGAVTTIPNLPNRVRSQPAYGATVLGRIPAGAPFTVLSGPYCGDNTAWWQVAYGEIIGWTAEGYGQVYWLEPR